MKQIIDGITYTSKNKPKPVLLGDCLKKFEIKKKHVSNEWQVKAFEIADKLKIDFKKNRALLPNWLSLFKRAFNSGKSNRLDKCYSFLADYPKNLDDLGKVKLFFWRFGYKEDKN